MSGATNIICTSCKRGVPYGIFFYNCHSYWPEISVVHYTCPLCLVSSEVQVNDGRLSFGSVSRSGRPHFARAETVNFVGLLARHDAYSVTIEVDGARWTVPE